MAATGPWVDAQARSKRYWLPCLHRLQVQFLGGTFTLYVLHAFGFAVAVHLPKRLAELWLREMDDQGANT